MRDFIQASPLQDRLFGVLVALANAAEGNEYLMDASIDRLLREGIEAALVKEVPETERLQKLIEDVQEMKWVFIPTCRECASPCGKYEPVDLWENRQQEGEAVFAVKLEILREMERLRKKGASADLLLMGLRAAGMWNPTEDMIAPALAALRQA